MDYNYIKSMIQQKQNLVNKWQKVLENHTGEVIQLDGRVVSRARVLTWLENSHISLKYWQSKQINVITIEE